MRQPRGGDTRSRPASYQRLLGTLQVRDKIVTSMRLMDAGLPTPEAYYAGVEQLRAIVGLPHRRQAELRAAGATDLGGKECTELERLDLSYGDIFAQQFVKGSWTGKAYVVGDKVFGVARPFPVRTAEEKEASRGPLAPRCETSACVAANFLISSSTGLT